MFPRYIESGVFDVRETPTSTMSAAVSPPPIPSSNLTANSIAAIRLKYDESSGCRTPGTIRAGCPEILAIEASAGPRMSQ